MDGPMGHCTFPHEMNCKYGTPSGEKEACLLNAIGGESLCYWEETCSIDYMNYCHRSDKCCDKTGDVDPGGMPPRAFIHCPLQLPPAPGIHSFTLVPTTPTSPSPFIR